LLNAFFASCEIAVITLNDNKLKLWADEGNKKAKKILKLTKNPSRFFATIQIGVTLSGFLASASAAQSFATPLANWLAGVTSINQATLNTLSTILITIILSFFTLVFGELYTKTGWIQKAENYRLLL
jgi:putative hemolysin